MQHRVAQCVRRPRSEQTGQSGAPERLAVGADHHEPVHAGAEAGDLILSDHPAVHHKDSCGRRWRGDGGRGRKDGLGAETTYGELALGKARKRDPPDKCRTTLPELSLVAPLT
jgi:hypothetical protein